MSLDLRSFHKALTSYENALSVIKGLIETGTQDKAQLETVRAGVIQNFEFTYELSWKYMKRWLDENYGSVYVDGVPRQELFRVAAEHQLISDVGHWIVFHRARNQTAHVYDQEIAEQVFQIANEFLPYARSLLERLEQTNDDPSVGAV